MTFYAELETERLFLRMPRKSDIKPYFNYQRDPQNYPFADLYPVKTIAEMEQLFLNFINKISIHDSIYWILEEKKSHKPIGSLSAWNIDVAKNSIEFGYNLFPKYRRKGYMAEAIRAAIDYLMDNLGFTVFDIWTDVNNTASRKLAEKLGFVFTGYVKEKAHNQDRIITYATYQLKLFEEEDIYE